MKKIALESIRMRDDLAHEGLSIPGSKSFTNYDTQVDVVYVTAEELEGAEYGDDPAHPDDHPFTYLKLKDGRSLYFISVDLDFDKVYKHEIVSYKLSVTWSDGKVEGLGSVLPEYLDEELQIYFRELEDLREEYDNDMRGDEEYTFNGKMEKTL